MNKQMYLLGILFIIHPAWDICASSSPTHRSLTQKLLTHKSSSHKPTHKPWTWFYKYRAPLGEHKRFSRKKLLVERADTPAFTQLIFSWNAQRPKRGSLVFWGQIRDAETKEWFDWHRMADWGSNEQTTHCSARGKDSSSYNYVRLEAPQGRTADAFRIKVDGAHGALLHDFSQLSICISNLPQFAIEPIGQLSSLPSTKVENVPYYSQMEVPCDDASRICSPTSLSMILEYFNECECDPLVCAQNTYDPGLDTYGGWQFNMAHAYTACEQPRSFFVRRLPSFAHLHGFLQKGTPVSVSIRGALKGMPKGTNYAQGHLLVVVGWDQKNKKVLCHDPAFPKKEQVPHAYDVADFIRAWERSRRLAYLSEPQ